jgi:hypothetical protein
MVVVITAAFSYSRDSVGRAILGSALLLGAVAPALLVRPGAVVFPETWAGIMIGLSLNAYIARRWLLGAALGVLAVFIRELAAPYALVCFLLALRDRRSSESVVWVLGGLGYGVYYTIHAVAASAAIQPGDLVRAHSYLRWLGLPFVFMTLYTYGWLTPLPAFVTPVAAALGLTGAWAPSAPIHLRATLLTYFALFCAVGQPFDFYWGYLTSPIWGHALAYAAEGSGALIRTALPVVSRRWPRMTLPALTAKK